MSSDKTSGGKPLFEARLCHVSKRADFDGYGFNLHAEKGRAGQFIGKVDEGSPAESAGLRQGDRIIEVNGANIGTETHKQVVERIKSVPNDTHLLVVDPKADISDPQQIALIEKAVNAYKLDKVDKSADKTEKIEHHPNPMPMKDQPTPEKNPEKEMSNGKDKMDGTQASKIEITSKAEEKNHTKSHDATNNNNTIQQMPSPVSQDETGKNNNAPLNLKMTAAELRAQLAAKKKYDPKNSTVDLREKYNMIQKL